MHAHNHYDPCIGYAFDTAGHKDEALSQELLIRNRALQAIDRAIYSGIASFSAFVRAEDVNAVRLASSRHARHQTHHVGTVRTDGGHYLKVVKRRSHHA